MYCKCMIPNTALSERAVTPEVADETHRVSRWQRMSLHPMDKMTDAKGLAGAPLHSPPQRISEMRNKDARKIGLLEHR